MATGDIYSNIYPKKKMDHEALADHLLEYMRKLVQDSQSTIYATSGFFNPVTLSADTIDSFDVTALSGQDDVSRILELAASNNVPFENANTVAYYVAVGYAYTPNEAEINPRTSLPEYKNIREEVGDVADPDSVVDDGDGTMTIVVDSVTEAGVSNAGRTVRVWLKDPISAVSWYEDCTVVWTGSNNVIYTTGALGQTTISTTASDYSVWRKGVTVKRNTDLSTLPAYAYIGTVTGAGTGVTPTVFSTSGQKILASDPNVALNLTTIYKDVYKTPTFPNDGNPKFAQPIEYWWEQEHNNSDYTHDDVTFQTLVAKLQSGLQLTIQALDVADESNIKAVFKDNGGSNASWVLGSGKFNIIDLQTRDTTVLGTASTDDLSILASIIADVAINSGGASSPAIKYYASGSLTRPFVMFNGAGELVIGRNDAVATDAIVKFFNIASATNKVNVEVQGTIRGYGNVILDGAAAATSPLLKFLANTAGEDWDVSVDSGTGVMTVNRNTAGNSRLKLIAAGASLSYLDADRVYTSGLEDANTTSSIPIASGADPALNTTAQNLVGAINEAFALAGTLPPHNHDDRYYTKTELSSTTAAFGSALIGYNDDNLPYGMEANSVQGMLDISGRMLSLIGKVPVGITYNSGTQHVSVPAQSILAKGFLRWRDTALNLTWTNLDSGVTRLQKHAYYVYLAPDASPLTTYTGYISDVAPQNGFNPTGGKEDWVYVGSFVTDAVGSGNVIPFRRAGNHVILQPPGDSSRLMVTYTAPTTDSTVNVGDTYAGVVPETATAIIMAVTHETRASSPATSGPVYALYAASESAAASKWSFISWSRSEATSGDTNRGSGDSQGYVNITSGRQFKASWVKLSTGGILVEEAILYRVGWIEDIYNGRIV